jgi:exonuclease SbcC
VDAPLPHGPLTAALNAALDAFIRTSDAARTADGVARAADEAARAAEAEARHAEELDAQAASAAVEAQGRLEALGADAGDSETLLKALAEAERRAKRAAEIADAARAAEQERAAAASRIDERSTARARASEAALAATATCTAAEAASVVASRAYAEHWRMLPGIALAPNAAALATMGGRLEAAERDAGRMLGAIGERLESAERERIEAERLRCESAASAQRAQIAGDLEQELHKNRFVAFIQREAMQILAGEAGARIEQLSRGRYRLRAEGDEFVVVDRFNGDEQRSVKTLSGGETFLASLALALALAERLPQLAGHGGALSLESLFLDEGFGSLDADALDVAIEALELLAGGDRMIGVISHVPLIAERLPDRIEVVKSGATSTVRG